MISHYFNQLKKQSLKDNYSRSDILKEDYLIDNNHNGLEIYYAPFDYINASASVVIVGITPGWTQMEIAYRTAIRLLKEGKNDLEVLRQVKINSSFAGSMRKNLIKMLDEIGLNTKLQTETCSALFEPKNKLLHSTSALKYPVFNNGKNYTGSSPYPLKNKLLWKQIERHFISELNNFENKLIIPLGKNVNAILDKLQAENRLNNNSILRNFPHPSGANGHRVKQFNQEKESLKSQIENWKTDHNKR